MKFTNIKVLLRNFCPEENHLDTQKAVFTTLFEFSLLKNREKKKQTNEKMFFPDFSRIPSSEQFDCSFEGTRDVSC